LKSGGVLASDALVGGMMKDMDNNSDGKVSFEEFVEFAEKVDKINEEESSKATMILIGRAKAGFHLKSINLAKIFEEDFGGGGHPKAA
jgi:Ca2+-binding EF-hand superfamily protein